MPKIEDLLSTYQEFVRPEIGSLLELLRLDVFYESAYQDRLIYESNGEKKVVYDFLGGYGSTILGHNPDVPKKTLLDALNANRVMHNQASLKRGATLLAEKLNQLMNFEKPYIFTFASTGAEAVEAALKHALMVWRKKQILNPVTEKPVLLALEGGFHGKTTSAVLATSNPEYKSMFHETVFDTVLISTELTNAEIEQVLKRYGSRIFAFIFEPVQGEGGIHEIAETALLKFQNHTAPMGIPWIVDEIQSGVFRTGEFLAYSKLLAPPEYLLLGKSLGASLVKNSACAIRRDQYLDKFGAIHSSTFSEDEHSSLVSLSGLEFLQSNKVEVKVRAKKFELNIKEFAEGLQKKFPGIIKQVRGKGFFIGIEFDFECEKLPSVWEAFYENGHASYLLASYLLHYHDIRVGVTLSQSSTIRLEPPWNVSEEAIAKLKIGLNDLCEKMYEGKVFSFFSHLFKQEFSDEQKRFVSPARKQKPKSAGLLQVGFLTHLLNADHVRLFDPSLKFIKRELIEDFLKKYHMGREPFCFHRQVVRGLNGQEVMLNLYGLFLDSHFFEKSLRRQDREAFECVQKAVDLAAADGMSYFGLGQYTSIVSNNGLWLKNRGIPLTTGNSLTAAMAIQGINQLVSKKNLQWRDLRLGVVGASGNICQVITEVLADKGPRLTLIHREALQASSKFQNVVQQLTKSSRVRTEQLILSADLTCLKDCDVVVIGTNSAKELIYPEHLKDDAIVLDISVPTNLHKSVFEKPGLSVFQGGLTQFPNKQGIDHPWWPLPHGSFFACLSETIALGLVRYKEPFSLGSLNKQKVLESLEIADHVGITLGGLRKDMNKPKDNRKDSELVL